MPATIRVNKLPADGYLILPISMSRIYHGQSPEICYEILEFFLEKLSHYGLDVVILYTNGLYYNSSKSATEIRHSSNEQITSHKNSLQGLIEKRKHFMPQAFHYLPWDYALLNSFNFQGNLNILKKAYKKSPLLQKSVLDDLGDRESNQENINFILEEVVMSHLIRQKMVLFPKTLVREDNFRLIIYPGKYIQTDFVQFKENVLPLNKKIGKRAYPYASGHYNYNDRLLYDFRKIENTTNL